MAKKTTKHKICISTSGPGKPWKKVCKLMTPREIKALVKRLSK